MTELTKQVETLIERAGKDSNSLYALQFSQAALNAVNALRVLVEVLNIQNPKIDKTEHELSGSEALFGFTAWLTRRKSEVTFSAKHDAGEVASLVNEFCKVNELAEPRENWTDRLTHPK